MEKIEKSVLCALGSTLLLFLWVSYELFFSAAHLHDQYNLWLAFAASSLLWATIMGFFSLIATGGEEAPPGFQSPKGKWIYSVICCLAGALLNIGALQLICQFAGLAFPRLF